MANLAHHKPIQGALEAKGYLGPDKHASADQPQHNLSTHAFPSKSLTQLLPGVLPRIESHSDLI